jgi:hypothetical protein
MQWTYDRGEPAVSCKMNRLKFKTAGKSPTFKEESIEEYTLT